MFDLSEDYKIKFCLDFFFGKINSKKFKQFKSQEENNGRRTKQNGLFLHQKREINMPFLKFFFAVEEKIK